MSDYQTLKAYGYSAFKALEIVISAKRGEFFATKMVDLARQSIPNAR